MPYKDPVRTGPGSPKRAGRRKAGELEELALAPELEMDPAAALQLEGVCKIVGTHRVLHLGSIERERVTREWASDVPCGYYGMIYLGGVYILGVHMGHKFISFSLLAWSIG